MKTKEGVFETDPLSEKKNSGETIGLSVGSNDNGPWSSPDLNSLRQNGLHRNKDVSFRISLKNLKEIESKTNYPFIVDWQMPETL